MQCKCESCGMQVKGMTCGKCDTALVDASINKDGNQIHVAKCPKGCGMIKSPVCCGEDMSCSAA